MLIEFGVICAITFANIPDKKYFTLKAVQDDLLDDAEEEARLNEKNEKSFKEKIKEIFSFDTEKSDNKDASEKPKEKKRTFSFSFKKKKNSEKDQDEQ